MRKLSEGQLEVEVTDKARKDEIGRMANALEVFRSNSLEVRRLRSRTGSANWMPPRSAARCSRASPAASRPRSPASSTA